MKKHTISTIMIAATILFNGCSVGSNCEQSAESKKLDSIIKELNTYAQGKYATSNKKCSDFKNKVLGLETLDTTSVKGVGIELIGIEIKDGTVLVSRQWQGLEPSKNYIVDLLDKKDDLKANIEKYISDCK